MQAIASRAHAGEVGVVLAHLLAQVGDVMGQSQRFQLLEQLGIQLKLVLGVWGGSLGSHAGIYKTEQKDHILPSLFL